MITIVRVGVLLLGLTATAVAQEAEPPALPALPSSGRFANWSELWDESWAFDPDDRPVLGFSVRATPAVRAALEAAETALRQSQPERAAALYAAMVGEYRDDVLPVAGNPPRWVGASEWALYQLLVRVPDSARAALDGADARRALAAAAEWRDVAALRRLAWRHEGTGTGRRAAELAARLLAESGCAEAARAAAERALLTGGDAALADFHARLGRDATADAPCSPTLPVRLDPVWSSPFAIGLIGKRNPFRQGPDYGEAPIAPIVPVARDGVVYVSDSLSISALDLYSGRRLWHFTGPLERIGANDPSGRWFGFDRYVDAWRDRAVSPYQVACPVLTDELVIATVQVPEATRDLARFDTLPINYPMPRRRLIALERATGLGVWEQERPEAGPDDFRNRFDVAGPVAIADGVVYAAGSITQGAINSYVAAFDLQTGELLWRTLLCAGQQDLTMFNRPFQEHTASPPCVADGSVYVSTNLGVVASVDAWSGRIRWLSAYEATVRRASRSPEHDQRRDVQWSNQPPLLLEGRLLVALLDGGKLLAFDPPTGRRLWSLDSRDAATRQSRHQLLATGGGRALLVGEALLEGLRARDGAIEWVQPILPVDEEDEVEGLATLCGERVFVPMRQGLLVCDATGPAAPRRLAWPTPEELIGAGRPAPRSVRRVLAADAVLLSTDNEHLFAAVDVDLALADLQARAGHSPDEALRAAELLLSTGRLAEAETWFSALLEGPRAERARTGRLEAGLRRARLQDDVERWDALLEVAQRLGDPWSVAAESLIALERLGAGERVDAWLDRLAALDGERRIDLVALTPDGPQPVAVVSALRRLPRDDPGPAVRRLQELLTRWPDETWEGRPLREQAARRIAALIEAHGRALYADFDREAERALRLTGDEGSISAIAARFPNARVVEEARRGRLEELLARGHARELLEELARTPAQGADQGLVELRARAARQLGELELADALEGRTSAPAPARLPALPGPGARSTTLEVSTRDELVFPRIDGGAAPPWDMLAPAMLPETGELLLLDPASARVAWRRPVSGLAYPSETVKFLRGGSRLFVQVFTMHARPDRSSDDLLEALSLEDGTTLWSRPMEQRERATVLASGLLLRLSVESQGRTRRYRLDGYGQATGVHALGLDLPPCTSAGLHRAGEHVVVSMVGRRLNDGTPVDVGLSRLDVARGELVPGAALPAESPSVAATLEDPPCVLITQRRGGPGAGSWLAGWDPAIGALAWTADVAQEPIDRRTLLTAGPGTALLLGRAPAESGGPDRLRIAPIHAHGGPQPGFVAGAGLELLAGQESGPLPRLVLVDTTDGARLIVVDSDEGHSLFELRLPAAAPVDELRVVHGRDAFLLVSDPGPGAGPAELRIVDAQTGAERYSVVLEGLSEPGQSEIAVVEGAVLLANGGSVRVIRG